jgi:hypothetical protein
MFQKIAQLPWLRFILAWFITFSLASICHSQFNLWRLQQVDVLIPLDERVSFTAQDWLGLLPTYGVIIAIALILAFSVTDMIMKYLLAARPYQQLLTIIAGALSILTVHSILYPILNVTLIAGARDSGLVIQMLCGALGGWAFYKQH